MAKSRWVPPTTRNAQPVPSIPLPFEAPVDISWTQVVEALRRLEFHTETLKPSFLNECLSLARGIRFGERQGEFRFRVGEREVVGNSYAASTVEVPTKLYELRCNRCQPAWACVHVAAVTLAVGVRIPEVMAILSTPSWVMSLAPLLEDTSPRQKPAPQGDEKGPAPGWIRYVLKTGEASDLLGGPRPSSNFIQRCLVRVSRKAATEHNIWKFPANLEEAGQRVESITEIDQRIDRVAEEIDLLESLAGFNAVSLLRAQAALRKLEADYLSLLPLADDVYVGESRVRVSAEPLTVELEIDDGKEGQLRLRFSPHIKALIPVARGWVLTADDVVRPLALDTHPGVIRLVSVQLPKVPVEQIPDFLDHFIPAVRVPLVVRTRHLRAAAVGTVPVMPRLIVQAHPDGLSVEARFGYAMGDAIGEVAATDGRPLVKVERTDGVGVGKPKLAHRHREAELGHLERLAAGGIATGLLIGDAGLDFLLDGIAKAQAIGWEVFADNTAKRLAPKGKLDPQVRVGSGLDWFDLKVSFEFEGEEVSMDAVLASWREGRKYHRLPDGTAFRLPDEWLTRHAHTLVELKEVRAAADGKMGAFAAPLVAELLEEAGNTAALVRWREIARKILNFDGVPEWPLPGGVQIEPREYQKRGFHWLVWMRDMDLGGVLADDMGLGKTLQTLLLLSDTHADPDGPPSLVVAPTSVVFNWAAEAKKFTPDLRIYVHHGSGRKDTLPTTGVDIIVTSYALLRYDERLMTETRFRYVVLDEAQQIKNPDSQIAMICQRIQADHRLALTGTPMENTLVELWSIYQFLMPGFFGSKAAFANRYANAVQKQQDVGALEQLRRRIRPFILRRRKEEVATELPPRTEQVLYCELGPAQRKLYEQVKATFRDQVLDKVATTGVGGATIQILEALMRLRQACCDPRLLPFEEARKVTASAKRSLLRETLEEIVAEGHRTLIFSQWPSLLRIVEEDLRALGLNWLYLDGHTRERQALVERWNDPSGPPVFLISLKAGGTGLNLTGADHVIHLDPWWNPAVERQATDRAHRIGQTKPVVVYKLVARDTVEEKILELQARKQALFDATIDAERLVLDSLTREELEAVFAPSTMSAAIEISPDVPDVENPFEDVLAPSTLTPAAERASRGRPPRRRQRRGSGEARPT